MQRTNDKARGDGMEFNMKTINERIKKRRKAEGFTQEDLAKRLNVQRQTISYYETCRTPTIVDLFLLAKELNTSTDYLLGLDEYYTPDKNLSFFLGKTGLNEETVQILSEWQKAAKEKPNRIQGQSFNAIKAKQILPLINAVLADEGFDSVRTHLCEFVENRDKLKALLSKIESGKNGHAQLIEDKNTKTDSAFSAVLERYADIDSGDYFELASAALNEYRLMQAAHYEMKVAFESLLDSLDGYSQTMQELRETLSFLFPDSTPNSAKENNKRKIKRETENKQTKPQKEGEPHADD